MRVSIVTINLNNLSGLMETFNNVVAQTFFDKTEFIVIDGGSDDGSGKFIIDNSDLISKFIIEKDSGVYDAMNKGAELASGEYIIYMNSGDTFFDVGVIQEFIGIDAEEDVVYGNCCMVREGGDGFYEGDHRNIFRKMPFNHQAVFTKSDIVRKFKFDTIYSISGDYDFYLRVFKFGAAFRKLDMTVSRHKMDGVSVLNPVRSCVESVFALQLHYPSLDLKETEYFAKILSSELGGWKAGRLSRLSSFLEVATNPNEAFVRRIYNYTKAVFCFGSVLFRGDNEKSQIS